MVTQGNFPIQGERCPKCDDGVGAEILMLLAQDKAITLPTWATDGTIAKRLHVETDQVTRVMAPIRAAGRGFAGWDM